MGQNGLIVTHTNFVTLKYVTDSWGTEQNGFTMVVTAFKDARKYGCRDGYLCDRHSCVDNDLVCDTVNHCNDGGDERSSQFCARKSSVCPSVSLSFIQAASSMPCVSIP